MPKKRPLTHSDKANLERYLKDSLSASLIVRSTFAGYFVQTDEMMKDIDELLRHHARIKQRLLEAQES